LQRGKRSRSADSRHRKEGKVETRLGPEEAIVERGRERRTVMSSTRFGASNAGPWAALTFDDGPDPLWTPRVLAALERADARATFFVVAPLALEHQGIVRAALEAGHGIQFHCTEHVRHTRRSRREVEADTRQGLRMLQSLGIEPRLWRPPWGILAPWTQEVAESLGLRLAPWSADTHDWRGDTTLEMLRRVEPLLGPGSILLMHDAVGPGSLRTGCEETVTLVGPLVERLRSIGCEPGPIASSLGPPVKASPPAEVWKAGT
jgi:peptidoglycan/xylan/chitin deacetylase (PgdA/CDA1 family)